MSEKQEPLLVEEENVGNSNGGGDVGSVELVQPVNVRLSMAERPFRNGEETAYDKLEFQDVQKDVSAGWGTHQVLGVAKATAIAGNDLTSSILYSVGLVTTNAGQLAPLCLLMVGAVMYLFRWVYSEACTAVPLNGGAYNLLLNTTSKVFASLAACLTILSYMATAVVSAAETVQYAVNFIPNIDVWVCTVCVLVFFAVVTLLGMKESGTVAAMIFGLHMITLATLAVFGIVYACQHPHIIAENWSVSLPYNPGMSLYLGFASAMLGVTGFESCANYVEEQLPGVFVKAMRNLWMFVMILNPTMCLVCFSVLTIPEIRGNYEVVLAKVGYVAGGEFLGIWVSVDACLVLAGSVLTAYIGSIGLIRRLALDRSMPQFFLNKNKLRNTNHWIIISFCGACVALFAMLDGDVRGLANIYALAFLSVMGMFALGNMMLKYKRGRIRREVKASWLTAFLALVSVVIALSGNIVQNPQGLAYFALYFAVIVLLLSLVFLRVRVFKFLVFLLRQGPKFLSPITTSAGQWIDGVQKQPVVFFAKDDNLEVLNKAVTYIRSNELCSWVKVVTFVSSEESAETHTRLARSLEVLVRCYPSVRIDMIVVVGEFNPENVHVLSLHSGVAKNFMFISCPGESFPVNLGAFGGVRMITH